MPNKRALIVDDSTTAQYRLKKMLKPYDLYIDVVDSGEAALRYLATNAPDVIFMDHLMPGMDGFRALQIIKSHPETATIPVIMYTSKSGDVYTGQARALGALDVVSKDTINAADLSKVMQTIHIITDSVPESGDTAPSTTHQSTDDNPDFIHAANKVSDTPPLIDRRAPSAASLEQARNLELRLSHLEHTLEDSRRFITSRVVRELQGLRQNIKQEFSDILSQSQQQQKQEQQQHHHHEGPVTEDDGIELADTPKTPSTSGWVIFCTLLVMAVLAIQFFYFEKMSDSFIQAQAEQKAQSEQLKNLAMLRVPAVNTLPPSPTSASNRSETAADAADKVASMASMADLAWAFNQSGVMQFNQNNMDPKVVIRLHELLNRVASNGFKGTVFVTVYVGNFCIAIDNLGQAMLPSDSSTMGNCMLSSEMYGLDRIMKQYVSEVENVLNILKHQQKKTLAIVVNSLAGTEAYPERSPNLNVKEWNSVALNNNHVEVRFEGHVGKD